MKWHPLRMPVVRNKPVMPPVFLSTAAEAKNLGMSRPYVTMLCDSGKLGPIDTSDDWQRWLRDALERYGIQAFGPYKDAPTMREAGLEARLYDHEDSQR